METDPLGRFGELGDGFGDFLVGGAGGAMNVGSLDCFGAEDIMGGDGMRSPVRPPSLLFALTLFGCLWLLRTGSSWLGARLGSGVLGGEGILLALRGSGADCGGWKVVSFTGLALALVGGERIWRFLNGWSGIVEAFGGGGSEGTDVGLFLRGSWTVGIG